MVSQLVQKKSAYDWLAGLEQFTNSWPVGFEPITNVWLVGLELFLIVGQLV
jgi:hypothetical protein